VANGQQSGFPPSRERPALPVDWVRFVFLSNFLASFSAILARYQGFFCFEIGFVFVISVQRSAYSVQRLAYSQCRVHGGAKEAPPIWGGVADWCRKSAIFGVRGNCKSLYKSGLKIYGIFEDSRIVLSHLVRYKYAGIQVHRYAKKGHGIF
jgi:hypothetical protein